MLEFFSYNCFHIFIRFKLIFLLLLCSKSYWEDFVSDSYSFSVSQLKYNVSILSASSGYWISEKNSLLDEKLGLIISVVYYDQSASLSWNKAPIWDLRPGFYYSQTVAVVSMWDALSDERTGLSFTIAAGTRQRSHSWIWVSWDSNLRFEISFFIASYDSQGYGGGSGTGLHIGLGLI
jgi:hypothetical protein